MIPNLRIFFLPRPYQASLAILIFLVIFLLAGCTGQTTGVVLPTAAPSATLTPAPTRAAATRTPTQAPSATFVPSEASSASPQPSATLAPTAQLPAADTSTPDLAAWHDLPVVPPISAHARDVYQLGLLQGNDPHAFAKVGDCETITDWFLVDFDLGPRYYTLGPYQDLQPVIDYFKGSFGRSSLAARRGFNAAALLTSFWSDPQLCKADEIPLACEYRIQRPSFALIMLGTNDVPHKASFEQNLRKVIEFSLAQNVLPVLVTKADNLEGDESINATIARLAQEYDVPLWNFWRAVQDLPGRGLVEDGAHLTHAPNHFDDPVAMQAAWPWRNLTALQVIQAVLQGVK
jgi:hypothetical protein